VDDVGDGPLHALGELLLDLLRHNRVLAVVQGMRLVRRLAGLLAGGVNLLADTRLATRSRPSDVEGWVSEGRTNRVGKGLLDALGCLLLDLAGNSGVGGAAGGVGVIHA
jgi:hypothetical protein